MSNVHDFFLFFCSHSRFAGKTFLPASIARFSARSSAKSAHIEKIVFETGFDGATLNLLGLQDANI
jgi:hypothetical protein